MDAERPPEPVPARAEQVAPELLSAVSRLGHSPRVIGVFRAARPERERPELGLELWQVRDPGNVGTLARAADAFGGYLALSEGCADPFGPKALRASTGSIFRVPLAEFSPEGCVALLSHGAPPLSELDPSLSRFVLGAEREGLPDEVVAACAATATIPFAGHAESLNVAMAGTIALYDWRAVAWSSLTGSRGTAGPGRTAIPEAVVALFTEDASYRSAPFREPYLGHDGIRAYWTRGAGSQEGVQVRMGEPVVDGNVVAVEWWTTMTPRRRRDHASGLSAAAVRARRPLLGSARVLECPGGPASAARRLGQLEAAVNWPEWPRSPGSGPRRGARAARSVGHERIRAIAGEGLEGCAHANPPKREVLFVSNEHLESVGVKPGEIRENLTIEGDRRREVADRPAGARR